MNPEDIIRQVEAGAHALMETCHVSYETGFLSPHDTDRFLPRDLQNPWRDRYFTAVEHTVRALPQLVQSKDVVRAITELEVPRWSFGDLPRESRYVFMLEITMLAHAAFREQLGYETVAELYRDQSEKYLWPQLAVPSWQLHELTGIDPTMAYWLYGLWNKRLKDPHGPHSPDNLEPVFTFRGNETEKWFVAIHHAIEAVLARATHARFRAYHTSLYGNEAPLEYLAQCLQEAAEYSMRAVDILKRMRERLNVRSYFSDVRMNYAFPRNVVFMGVQSLRRQGKHFNGETGGGSAAAHQLGDAVRGTQFQEQEKAYVRERRMQMPAPVRRMLSEIESTSRVRELVLANRGNARLVAANNADAQAAVDFGVVHDELAAESIAAFGDRRGTASPWLILLGNMNEARAACVVSSN